MRLAMAMLGAGLAMLAGRAGAQTPTFPVPTTPVSATSPPAQYGDTAGPSGGRTGDRGNEVARRLCVKPDYANVAFEAQIPGLQNRRWDMIDTGLYYTPARAKVMHLIPYGVNALALVVPAGNPKAVAAPKDLAGKAVGVEVAGFEEKTLRAANDAQVEAGLPAIDIRVFNTYGDTFQALRAGQVEAVFAPDLIGAYYQKQGRFALAASGLYPGSPVAFATDDGKLASAVVTALAAMLADGTYGRMMAFYGAAGIDKWPAYPGKFQDYHTP